MKRILSILLTLVMLFSFVCPVFSVGADNNNIVNYATPTNGVKLKFAKKMGSGYKAAPTTPVVYKDTLIVLSGGVLYKLKNSDGKEIASVKVSGTNTYTTVSPKVADGKIFVQLDNGKVQAFDYSTMKSLWIYTDPLGGQALCNISYSSGYIYTGFWNGEAEAANYVCLSTSDDNTSSATESKKATWTYKSKGGFYWADACITGKYVLFGCDNGVKDSTSASQIVCLNKTSGKKAGSISVNGDIRSGVTYYAETKRFYVSSKAGYLYSFAMDTSTGALSGKKTLALAGPATSTPSIYGNRVYLGSSDGGSGGRFYAIDATTLKTIYYGTLDGYSQSTPLVSYGYGGEGKIYIYMTVNSKPGSVYMFTDTPSQKTVSKKLIYSPDSQYSEYCISSVTADSNGDLYYKNDSGTIFALSDKKSNTSSVTSIWSRILAFFRKLFGIQ